MGRSNIRLTVMGMVIVFGWSPTVSQAAMARNVALGLGAVGFDFQGNRNPLSGGIDLLGTNTFAGNTLNFGVGDLTLQGSLSMTASTASRFLRGVDLSLQTAPNGSAIATPLNYLFNVDLGVESARVTGNVLIDSNVSINELGFYDLSFTYSSRQTVDRAGVLANDSQNLDFDLGPINVSGNVFADALVVLTEPFFQNNGTANPFAALSGTAQLKELIDAQTQTSLQALTDGTDPADLILIQQANEAVMTEVVLGTLLQPGNIQFITGDSGASPILIVPEPAVLVLLLLGLPLLLRRR